MSRGPHSEAQLLRIATRRGDPDAALTAIAELRRRLDTLEAAHVDEAVGAGWSWQRIADSLGVTRQAAHSRHARRSRQGRGQLVVAGRARRAVRRAREEAARMGAEAFDTDHLLLGLLLDPEDSPVKEALDAIDYEQVHARAQRERRLRFGRPEVSPQARHALEQSMREAVARGDARLDVEHLLLAVLHEPGGRGQRAVMAAGHSPNAVERRLSRALRAQSSASSGAS